MFQKGNCGDDVGGRKEKLQGLNRQAKNFEEWYNTRKDEQGAIYKAFEEFTTSSSIFKELDYDKYSFLIYDNNVKMIIEDFIKSVNDNTEDLIKRVIDKNSIEEINDVKIDFDRKLEKLKKQFL
ncbi:unnamed protein product [Rhizophagus irregularis]|nr:unnamed protein product [Rhizophagus irregularis]